MKVVKFLTLAVLSTLLTIPLFSQPDILVPPLLDPEPQPLDIPLFSQSDISVSFFAIYETVLVNEEKSPKDAYNINTAFYLQDDGSFYFRAKVNAWNNVYGTFLFDFDGDGFFDETKENQILKSDNGYFSQRIKLSEKQLAYVREMKGLVDVQFRSSEDISQLYSPKPHPPETAVVNLYMYARRPPIGEVKTGEGDQHQGVLCIFSSDDFIRVDTKNGLGKTIEFNSVTVTNPSVATTITPSLPAYLQPNERGTFTLNFGKTLSEVFSSSEDPCFDITVEMEYRKILHIASTFIDDDEEPYIQFDTIYSLPETVVSSLTYCWCDDEGRPSGYGTGGDDSAASSRINDPAKTTSIIKTPNLTIHPTPAIDYLVVEYALDESTITSQIILNSINGAKISNILETGPKEKGTYSYRIDTSHLPPGIYYLSLKTDQSFITQKVIFTK